MKQFIQNTKELANTTSRKHILEIAEAAYNAIDTEGVVRKNVRVQEDKLTVGEQEFDLKKFNRVRLIGFGKASCLAIAELERIFGARVTDGIVIDKKAHTCEVVEVFEGSHPRPSAINVEASGKIVELAKGGNEKDLVVVVVSGGGSSLLCFPSSECDQGIKLYDRFLGSGGTISELNTVRKHISLLKGGGLAKLLYPATVISLIFSDVPGDNYFNVASGPTYKDKTTTEDARAVLEKYNCAEDFKLMETPKEDYIFEKVYNIPLVSNTIAIKAMKEKAEELGYDAFDLGGELYDFPEQVLSKFNEVATPGSVVVGGGEPRIIVKGTKGTGGRNQLVALTALKTLGPKDSFLAFASDGIDNKSVFAGAIADAYVLKLIKEKNANIDEFIAKLDTEGVLGEVHSLLLTGPTGSNVSDLMVMIREK